MESEEKRGIMGCQWNDRVSIRVLTPRYKNRFDEGRLCETSVIVIDGPDGSRDDGITCRDRIVDTRFLFSFRLYRAG